MTGGYVSGPQYDRKVCDRRVCDRRVCDRRVCDMRLCDRSAVWKEGM